MIIFMLYLIAKQSFKNITQVNKTALSCMWEFCESSVNWAVTDNTVA